MQSFPTVLIPFDVSRASAVDAQLDALGNPAAPSIGRALGALGTVHFMSINAVATGGQGACLVLEASVDGDPHAALTAIAGALTAPLLALLNAAGVGVGAAGLAGVLIAHSRAVGPSPGAQALGLCFAGTPGMSVARIRREDDLARRIRREMGSILAQDRGALAKLERVRAALWQAGDLKWAFAAEPVPWLRPKPKHAVAWRGAWWLGGVALAFLLARWSMHHWIAAFALIIVAAGAVLLTGAWLRHLERTNLPEDPTPDAGRVREAMDRENFGTQNLLVSVTDLQDRPGRRLALRGAFLVIQALAKRFSPGYLAGIGTIHFARWVLLPGSRKLVFLSNYDGSLESYLEDFIQRAREGVTAIWSNVSGFPRSKWLIMDGARDGDRFRRFVLRSRLPARFWYSAYPSLTTGRIRANAAIRYGLAAATTDDEAEAWLACFGSAGRAVPVAEPGRPRETWPERLERWAGEAPPAPRVPLEEAKIPTLVFGARRRLGHATCLMVEMAGDPDGCRAWLAALEPDVAFGAQPRDEALVLALAASAFDKLGLPPEDLATFPPPFLNGMAAPCRARALGDLGWNAPENWLWGGAANPVDALVIAYDADPSRLDRRLAALEADLRSKGHRVAYRLPLPPLPPSGAEIEEPFGFADGVSQPLIRGAGGKHLKAANGDALQEAGEFVLGYRDNSGYLPSTPTVASQHDPDNLLCGPRGGAGRRDLGRNGAYVAVRQLAQDTRAFARWLDRAALALGDTSLASLPACAVKDVVSAKLVGRWRNGSAPAQHPANPGAHRRNDFLYGALDPSGLGCPFGAHARRANPRDSLDPGSDVQLSITDRHRILRVGRRYDASEAERQPGLLFMGLNADFDRQFEFIQQTWLLGRSFHGLEDEGDALLGQGPRSARVFTVHTGTGPVRLPLPERSFVTTKGGGYFFMPGRDALRFLAHRRPADHPAQRAARASPEPVPA